MFNGLLRELLLRCIYANLAELCSSLSTNGMDHRQAGVIAPSRTPRDDSDAGRQQPSSDGWKLAITEVASRLTAQTLYGDPQHLNHDAMAMDERLLARLTKRTRAAPALTSMRVDSAFGPPLSAVADTAFGRVP